MMMRMLTRGGMPILDDGLRHADADNPHGYFEYQPAKRLQRDPAWLSDAVGKAVKIVAQLVQYLPAGYAYQVIFMERDLHEVLASQQVMLERQARKGADLMPEQLATVFANQVRRLKNWLANQPNIQTLHVSYASVFANPFAGAATINRFLGGTLDTDQMAGAVDTTLYRQKSETC